jgi:hypothetical protein
MSPFSSQVLCNAPARLMETETLERGKDDAFHVDEQLEVYIHALKGGLGETSQ